MTQTGIFLKQIHDPEILNAKTVIYIPEISNAWDFPLLTHTFKKYNVYAISLDFSHSDDIEKITKMIHNCIENANIKGDFYLFGYGFAGLFIYAYLAQYGKRVISAYIDDWGIAFDMPAVLKDTSSYVNEEWLLDPKIQENMEHLLKLKNTALQEFLKETKAISKAKILINAGVYVHALDNKKLLQQYFPNAQYLYGNTLEHTIIYKHREKEVPANLCLKLRYGFTYLDLYDNKLAEWFDGNLQFQPKVYNYPLIWLISRMAKQSWIRKLLVKTLYHKINKMPSTAK